MPIRFRCSCGKPYNISEVLAGAQIVCNQCQTKIRVPGNPAHGAAQLTRPETPGAPAPTMVAKVQRENQSSAAVVSNPGLLRINPLRFALAFPLPMLWTHLPFLVCVLGLKLSWWFLLLVIPAAIAVFWYWKSVFSQFAGGVINPGIIVSLNPPLVGVYTDLSMGEGAFPVVKIFPHPIHRMSTGLPHVGQRVSTIAVYQGAHYDLSHWFDVLPVVTSIVTGDSDQIQRVFDSIPHEEWEAFAHGLHQLPPNSPAGTYPVFQQPAIRPPELSIQEIRDRIRQRMYRTNSEEMYSDLGILGPEINAHLRTQFSGPSLLRDVNCAFVQAGSDQPTVFLLKDTGLAYWTPRDGTVFYAWNQIKIAYIAIPSLFCLVLHPYSVRRIERDGMFTAAWVGVENMINDIVRRPAPSQD